MFKRSVSSRGMRLVPKTNTQKTSASRLLYKAFGGAKSARFKRRIGHMSNPLTPTPSEPEWAALAAIDWADQKNFWRLLPAGSRQSESGELDNTPEAVEVWAANLQQRFGGRPIAVILEQSRGALVYMLTKYPHLVLFPCTPPRRHVIGRPSRRRAPRVTPATRTRCWICCCVTANACAPCGRILRKPGCCISWSRNGGQRWTKGRARACG